MPDILKTILRGIIAFTLLIIATRITGRKAISQMNFFHFATAITMGTLTVNIGVGANSDSTTASIILITFTILGILTAYLHTKNLGWSKLVNSKPLVLIQNGEIVKDNMQKKRISIGDLTTILRHKDMFNIADVEFAIPENYGKLSVQPKPYKQALTPSHMNIPTSYVGLTKDIIINGTVMYENLQDAGLNKDWLLPQLGNS